MVLDVAGSSFEMRHMDDGLDEDPSVVDKKFFDMLHSAYND